MVFPKAPPHLHLRSRSRFSSSSPHRYHLTLSTIMKSIALLTASALLSTASAEVYKLKLNKVPLTEQLVRSVRPGW